jgi:hypothetical protein
MLGIFSYKNKLDKPLVVHPYNGSDVMPGLEQVGSEGTL